MCVHVCVCSYGPLSSQRVHRRCHTFKWIFIPVGLRPIGLKSGRVDGQGSEVSGDTEAPKKSTSGAQSPSTVLFGPGAPFKYTQRPKVQPSAGKLVASGRQSTQQTSGKEPCMSPVRRRLSAAPIVARLERCPNVARLLDFFFLSKIRNPDFCLKYLKFYT